ncbi:MAG: hypothetical protein AAGI01_16130, partial [Myxococcota bacterium]
MEALSLWYVPTRTLEARVIAEFISKKERRSRVAAFLFPKTLLDDAHVDYECDTAPDSHDCIRHNHMSADFSAEGTRLGFAKCFLCMYREGRWTKEDGMRRVSKGKNAEFVGTVLSSCPSDVASEIVSELPEWLRSELVGA